MTGKRFPDDELGKLVDELAKGPLTEAFNRDRERLRRGGAPVGLDAIDLIHWWLDVAESKKEVPRNLLRLIALWEAFNGWLRVRGLASNEKTSDKALIQKFSTDRRIIAHFEQLVVDESYRDSLDALKSFCPVYESWGGFRTGRSKSIRDIKSLPDVIDLVYWIRCNLMHGGKGSSERDQEITGLAFAVLYPLFKRILDDREITFVPAFSQRSGQ